MGRVDVILTDMRKTYPTGFGFVIAQSTSPVTNAGFAVVYRDEEPFVPTAHEVTAVGPYGLVEMDATILAFNTVLLPSSSAVKKFATRRTQVVSALQAE